MQASILEALQFSFKLYGQTFKENATILCLYVFLLNKYPDKVAAN